MYPNTKVSLQQVNEEVSSCTRCSLGVRRELHNYQPTYGEGARHGIMIIGEGAGKNEELQQRIFCGQAGTLLRRILQKLNIEDVCYLTNIVKCRSCKAELLPDGTPMTRTIKGITHQVYKDQPPLPAQISACRHHLLQEIYTVDPLLIVTLGGTAASALAQRPVSILSEAGKEFHADIPGAAHVPVVSEKTGTWGRVVKGVRVLPTAQHMVQYLCIPTLHPAYVVRAAADRSENSPMRKMFSHLKTAAEDYAKLAEYYGIRTHVQPTTARVEDVWTDEEESDD